MVTIPLVFVPLIVLVLDLIDYERDYDYEHDSVGDEQPVPTDY